MDMSVEKSLRRASSLLAEARGWLEDTMDKLKAERDEKIEKSDKWEKSPEGEALSEAIEKLEEVITEIETAEGSIDELIPTED